MQWGIHVIHVLSGDGGRGSCTQCAMLSNTCLYCRIGEDRRISAMYAVGDAQ